MSSQPNTTAAATAAVRTVRPDERVPVPGPPGAPFLREQCFDDGHVWVGIVTTQPGAATPWHHHGEYDTYAYVLEGEATIEFGEGGRLSTHARADGSCHLVPKGCAHREINTGSEPNRILIMRVGEGPPVVPLEGPAGCAGGSRDGAGA
jgi:mannose-6-phosphate isomerase-like protein (cupin superfamily)